MVSWLAGWMVGWMDGWLDGWLAGLTGLPGLASWLVGWLAGRLVAGWLVGCYGKLAPIGAQMMGVLEVIDCKFFSLSHLQMDLARQNHSVFVVLSYRWPSYNPHFLSVFSQTNGQLVLLVRMLPS